MLRRFVLIGVMIVVYNGSMVQLTLGTLFAAILLFFQVLGRAHRLQPCSYKMSPSPNS